MRRRARKENKFERAAELLQAYFSEFQQKISNLPDSAIPDVQIGRTADVTLSIDQIFKYWEKFSPLPGALLESTLSLGSDYVTRSGKTYMMRQLDRSALFAVGTAS